MEPLKLIKLTPENIPHLLDKITIIISQGHEIRGFLASNLNWNASEQLLQFIHRGGNYRVYFKTKEVEVYTLMESPNSLEFITE